MSLLPFLRNFIGVEGDNAAAGVVKALVQLDPDSATIADLRTMEQDLDNAGRMIAKLRADLAHEQAEFDSLSGAIAKEDCRSRHARRSKTILECESCLAGCEDRAHGSRIGLRQEGCREHARTAVRGRGGLPTKGCGAQQCQEEP